MARLGDICTVVSGSTPKTGVAEYWDGNVKWITPAELNEDSFYITDSVRHITEDGKEKTGLSYLPKGTVILSSRAPIGKTAIAGCEMCCNQGFKNLICSDAVYNEYLYFFLNSKTDYLNSLGRGATFKEISKSIVEKVEIPLPNIEKQHQIVKELKATRNLITHRKQQLTKLDELIKARFVEMFGDPVTNPFNWPTVELGQRCEIITGNTPSRAEPENYGTFIEWIKSDNINTPSTFLTPAQEYLSEVGFQKCRFVESGSLLMTCIAGSLNCIGNVAVTNRRVAFNQQINAITPTCDNVLYLYWLMILSKPAIHKTINMALKGILSKSQLSSIKFPFPSIECQNQFAAFVAEVDKSKVEVQKALDQTQLLFDSLMQQYFG